MLPMGFLMNKQILDDVWDTHSNPSKSHKLFTRLGEVRYPLIACVAGLVILVGFVAAGIWDTPDLVPSSSQAFVEDEHILAPSPIPQPTVSVEPVSNTVSESVVYIEFLDTLSDSQSIVFPSSGENSYTVGDYSFSLEGFSPISNQIWNSDNATMVIGAVDTHSDLLQQVISSYESSLGLPEYIQPYSDAYVSDRMNYSLADIQMYVYQQTIQVGSIQLFESMLVVGNNFVSFISTLQPPTELTDTVRVQIANEVSANHSTYQVLGIPVTRYQTFNGIRFITPKSASDPIDMGTYSYVDLGDELSNNRLYMLTLSQDKISSLSTTIGSILSLDKVYSSDSRLTLSTEVNATWLYRYAKYIEFEHGISRIPCYVFPNSITNQCTIFFIAEQDNKFPYLLRYLNTLALEVI